MSTWEMSVGGCDGCPCCVMIFLGQGAHQQKSPCVLPLALLRGGCVRGMGQQAAHFCPKIQEQQLVHQPLSVTSFWCSAEGKDHSHPKHFAMSP